VRTVATIGVYESSRDDFLSKLHHHRVVMIVDVRQRRGVRGPQYAWANSLRLQDALREAKVAYQHRPELAPTTELRHLQYREDDRAGVGKRSRVELAKEYRRGYLREILDQVDLGELLESLPDERTSALLCVERDAAACHRSLIADRLKAWFSVPIVNL
jgi:uncharacterized protein (DUF488 family)